MSALIAVSLAVPEVSLGMIRIVVYRAKLYSVADSLELVRKIYIYVYTQKDPEQNKLTGSFGIALLALYVFIPYLFGTPLSHHQRWRFESFHIHSSFVLCLCLCMFEVVLTFLFSKKQAQPRAGQSTNLLSLIKVLPLSSGL